MKPGRILNQLPSQARIAVVRALNLGDMLCAVPAWRALRQAVPDALITLVGLPWADEFAAKFHRYFDQFQAFPGFPDIPQQPLYHEELARFRKRTYGRFDLVIQMHGRGPHINWIVKQMGACRSVGFQVTGDDRYDLDASVPYSEDINEVERQLRLIEFLGAPLDGDHLEFPVAPGDLVNFLKVASRHNLSPRKYACVHLGATCQNRRWPIDRYAAIADHLADRGLIVVLTGSASETRIVAQISRAMTASHINLAGQTDLGLFAQLLAHARLLVCNKRGASHIATAVQTPSVFIVRALDSIRPASRNGGRYQVELGPRPISVDDGFACPIGHDSELRLFTTDVRCAIESLLADPGRHTAPLNASLSVQPRQG